MQTIVLLDRLGKELMPLTASTCTALLPVACKPLVQYTIETLATAGIKEALVVTGPFSEKVKELLGNGQRWGLQLDYWLGRGEEPFDILSKKLPESSGSQQLVVRGDILRSPMLLAGFLEAAASQPTRVAYAVAEGRPAGIALRLDRISSMANMGWDRMLTPGGRTNSGASPINLEGSVRLLDSLQGYHQANLDAVRGHIVGLELPGREIALGLRHGRNSVVSPRSLTVGAALVGNYCRIHPEARLAGSVVISDRVIIDRQAQLHNALVLPDSYIGELVTVDNAIVSGNDLIDVETGGSIKVVDAFLLADLRERSLSRGVSSRFHQIFGLVLLLLSLPIWPLALIAALVSNAKQPLRFRRLRGNRVMRNAYGQPERQEFTAVEWATSITPLAKLPWLWAVVSGDLRLVGVEPVTREEASGRTAEWELLADSFPAGLLGPTQLNIPLGAPPEERLMSDAFFAGQRDGSKEWRVLWDGFLSLFRLTTWWPKNSK